MKNLNRFKINNVVSISNSGDSEAFNKLIGMIRLTQDEDYDCTKLNIWSYRKSFDIRDGVNVKFGNMCNGFPFKIWEVPFINSECAYIAGAYSNGDENSILIQQMIAKESNGQKCKRIFRLRSEFTNYSRKDFYEFNIQWMLYVLWQKSNQNKEFAGILRCIPIEAHVVENTSLHNGETSIFWGAKNKELMAERKISEIELSQNGKYRFKKDLKYAQMLAANTINEKGHFVGKNVMGKIIKLCSLSLIYGQEPPIDYNLLGRKNIYMLGKQIKLPNA